MRPSLPKPFNSMAMLADTGMDIATFRPDVSGDYIVQLVTYNGISMAATPAGMPTQPVEIMIQAGKWVGAGVFNTHDPEAVPTSPQCGTGICHGDMADDRLNILEDWVTSDHAQKLQMHMDGTYDSGHYTAYCLPCHTLGLPIVMNHEASERGKVPGQARMDARRPIELRSSV